MCWNSIVIVGGVDDLLSVDQVLVFSTCRSGVVSGDVCLVPGGPVACSFCKFWYSQLKNKKLIFLGKP